MVISCGNTSDNVNTTPTVKFVLIPHEPGEAPLIPHPKQLFDDCELCHIDILNTGSVIKVFWDHTCNECHMNMDYAGSCMETEPINNTCIVGVCHNDLPPKSSP